MKYILIIFLLISSLIGSAQAPHIGRNPDTVWAAIQNGAEESGNPGGFWTAIRFLDHDTIWLIIPHCHDPIYKLLPMLDSVEHVEVRYSHSKADLTNPSCPTVSLILKMDSIRCKGNWPVFIFRDWQNGKWSVYAGEQGESLQCLVVQ
jgi:hypothetical protein